MQSGRAFLGWTTYSQAGRPDLKRHGHRVPIADLRLSLVFLLLIQSRTDQGGARSPDVPLGPVTKRKLPVGGHGIVMTAARSGEVARAVLVTDSTMRTGVSEGRGLDEAKMSADRCQCKDRIASDARQIFA